MKPETKYKGCIKLSAIGDALGWITEFEKNKETIKEKFGTERIENFYTWKKNVGGRFYGYIDVIKPGSYSDDTQLLLAVARSIKKNGDVDHNYFAKIELPNWLDYARGGGRTVKTAANKITRKSTKWFNNFYNFKVNGQNYDYKESGANGAAMRILPIALANLGNTEKIKEEIFSNSIITHGHPRAILGAMLYGYAINQMITLRPDNFNWENYITQIGLDFPQKFDLSFIKKNEILEWLKEWNKSSDKKFEIIYAETITETQNQLRLIYQSIKLNLPLYDTLKKIGCFDLATKGSGISTVIAGIYLSTKFHDEPLKAIIESVNALGSDTDSIAAFTGGLVGALHGQGIIPEKWKAVQDIEYLDKMAIRLLAISEDSLNEETTISLTNLKLLNNPKKDDFNVNEFIEFNPLGTGKIVFIDRQKTLTKGKYNLLIEVLLDNGQSILISKLFNEENSIEDRLQFTEKDILLKLALSKLKIKTFNKLKEFVTKEDNISKEMIEIMVELIKNDD
jgi:ADP-ribosylglycohydrolase